MTVLEEILVILEAFGSLLGGLGDILEAILAVLEASAGLLEASWTILEASWRRSWPSWRRLWRSWSRLGGDLGRLRGVLEAMMIQDSTKIEKIEKSPKNLIKPMDFSLFWSTEDLRRRWMRAWSKGFYEARSSKKDRLYPCPEHAHDSPRWSGGSCQRLRRSPPAPKLRLEFRDGCVF